MAQVEVTPHELLRYSTSPPVTITVDEPPNQRTFYVNSALLIHASQYFRTALKSNFKEGETQICRLEEDNADAFDLFVQYLHSTDYDVTLAFSKEEGGTGPMYYRMQAAAYALGNKLVAPKFKRLVLCKLAMAMGPGKTINMKCVVDMAATVYHGTSTDDGQEMRTVMAKYCASRFGKSVEDETSKANNGRWNKVQITTFAECQLSEFISDVLLELQGAESWSPVGDYVANLGLPIYQFMTCNKLIG